MRSTSFATAHSDASQHCCYAPVTANVMRRRAAQIFVIVSAYVMAPSASWAEIYRWVDEGGKVHFSDKPSRSHSSEEVKLRINTYEGVTYDTSSIDVGQRKVVIYSASWCGVCKKAKRYFTEKGIKYTEYDVEKNAEGKLAFKKLGGKGVPIILVGKQRMNGFSIDGFEKLYH